MLDMFKFYAWCKMYTNAATVSNDIEIVHFTKIDSDCNLFNKNCADLLNIYPLQPPK